MTGEKAFLFVGLIVEIVGVALITILVALYFFIIVKKDTGDNESEQIE